MLKNNGFAGVFLLTVLFIACGGDNDLTAPEIEVLESEPALADHEICGSLTEGYALISGDTLLLDLMITDNEELSELKVEVHDNFDCHGHGGSQTPAFETPNISNTTNDWTVLDIIDLDGDQQALTLSLPVPGNVTAGFYHFALQVVDASGNEAEGELIYDLDVMNSSDTLPPFVNISQPTNSPIESQRGEEITFTGTVQDNQPLDAGGNGVVYINYKKREGENVFGGPFTVFPQGTGNRFDYDLRFTVPETLTTGDYRIFIYAHDGVRNVAQPVIFDLKISD